MNTTQNPRAAPDANRTIVRLSPVSLKGVRREETMQSMESLVALVGQPVDTAAVQALIASEQLHSTTEEDLEEGEPVESHLSSASGGYEFSHTLGRLNTLFIHVKPKDEYAAFRGTLTHGLTAQSTRLDVRRSLGTPSRSGEAQTLPPLGRHGGWDRFDSNVLCLHFQYSELKAEIELITVMMADIAPGGVAAE